MIDIFFIPPFLLNPEGEVDSKIWKTLYKSFAAIIQKSKIWECFRMKTHHLFYDFSIGESEWIFKKFDHHTRLEKCYSVFDRFSQSQKPFITVLNKLNFIWKLVKRLSFLIKILYPYLNQLWLLKMQDEVEFWIALIYSLNMKIKKWVLFLIFPYFMFDDETA